KKRIQQLHEETPPEYIEDTEGKPEEPEEPQYAWRKKDPDSRSFFYPPTKAERQAQDRQDKEDADFKRFERGGR
ncbi:unnamed protein product, partial [marine sediment metagenome]